MAHSDASAMKVVLSMSKAVDDYIEYRLIKERHSGSAFFVMG